MKKQLLLTLLAITPIATTSCANWSYSTNLENCIKQHVKPNDENIKVYFTFNHCDLILESNVNNYFYTDMTDSLKQKEYTGKKNIYYIDYSYVGILDYSIQFTYEYKGYVEYLVNVDYCIWRH